MKFYKDKIPFKDIAAIVSNAPLVTNSFCLSKPSIISHPKSSSVLHRYSSPLKVCSNLQPTSNVP